MTDDTTTNAILWQIDLNGYTTTLRQKHGVHVVTALDRKTGERYIVRAEDRYSAACRLAERVGIDLEDGRKKRAWRSPVGMVSSGLPLAEDY